MKLKVIAKQTTFYVAEIEAETLDEAHELVDNIDFDEFKELPEIDWQIYDIFEVK